MYGSRRLITVMVLLLLLPLAVAALAAVGFWRLDRYISQVAEEYGEVRALQPIDGDLKAASIALASSDPATRTAAVHHLAEAEGALSRYLATQYETVATAEHQSVEAQHALSLLDRLRALQHGEGRDLSGEQQAIEADTLRTELNALMRAADLEVLDANRLADEARTSAVSVVYVASLLSMAICLGLLVWTTTSVFRHLRELHGTLNAQFPGSDPAAARSMGGVVSQIREINTRLVEKVEETGRELLRRERLAGIGLLAADVAHEINNPMNAMLGLSEIGVRTLESGPLDASGQAELLESLRVVRREALRSKGIVERLMAMVRSDHSPDWFDVRRLVRETVQVAQAARPDKAKCFSVTGGDAPLRAFGPADDVRQILLTLLINAADAVGPDGRIEADAARTGREVWLRVRDNGRGFTEAMRRTFFTPFRTYSENGRGTGLGLSIARALAEGMGATLQPFSDGPGQGSLFVLAIPLPEGAS